MRFIVNKEFKDTPIGRIPKEWRMVEIKDITFLIRNGLTYRNYNRDGEGYPIARIETISEGKIDIAKTAYLKEVTKEDLMNYRLQVGDILFSHINSIKHVGKAALYEGQPELLLHGMNILLIRPNTKIVSPLFLLYLINWYRNKEVFAKIAKRAVNQASINQTQLSHIKITLPSLEEQEKIAEILSTVDSAIEKVDGEISKIEQLKKGLMQELLTKGIGHKEFKDTTIGRIPKEWELLKLGDVIIYIKGKKPKKSFEEYQDGYLPYLSTEYLREDKPTNYVKPSNDDVIVDDGDLLLLWDGSNSGEFFYGKQGILSSTMVKIEQKKLFFNQKFLFYLLKLKERELKGTTKGTGIPHVEKSVLNNMFVQNPPLSEQEKIAEILSTVDELLDLKKRKKEKLQKLKKGLMDLLLMGKIRVIA